MGRLTGTSIVLQVSRMLLFLNRPSRAPTRFSFFHLDGVRDTKCNFVRSERLHDVVSHVFT